MQITDYIQTIVIRNRYRVIELDVICKNIVLYSKNYYFEEKSKIRIDLWERGKSEWKKTSQIYLKLNDNHNIK